MDECLPLGSLDASTLRMLLEKERERRTELEREVARLQAGLARQNEVIVRLEQRDAERRRELAEHRTLIAGLTEQNALLRQQVARLEQENARLRGMPLAPAPAPVPAIRPAIPTWEKKTRKKRAPEHNTGRRRMERATR
jgi:septal ring factor EnvC (AmiA/AmiB activator)